MTLNNLLGLTFQKTQPTNKNLSSLVLSSFLLLSFEGVTRGSSEWVDHQVIRVSLPLGLYLLSRAEFIVWYLWRSKRGMPRGQAIFVTVMHDFWFVRDPLYQILQGMRFDKSLFSFFLLICLYLPPIPLRSLLPGPLWLGVGSPDRVLSMGKIELSDI